MLVFIAAGGRTGAQLASQLIQQNYEVRLVEKFLEEVQLFIRTPA